MHVRLLYLLCMYYCQNTLWDSTAPNHLGLSVRRKFSGKSKKWKSIFNLGRSVDSKGKLSRNGSVLIRAQGTGKVSNGRVNNELTMLTEYTHF